MKRRFIFAALVLALSLITLLPAAAKTVDIRLAGAPMTADSYLYHDGSAFVPSATKPNADSYAHLEKKTSGKYILTLHNFDNMGEASLGYNDGSSNVALYLMQPVTIVLEGKNTLTAPFVTSGEEDYDGHGIFTKENCAVTIEGSGSLTVNADSIGIYADSDLTINSGKLDITSNKSYAVHCKTGDISITGGELDITAKGELDIIEKPVAVYCETGNINITGGELKLTSDSAAVYAKQGNVTIDGSNNALSIETAAGGIRAIQDLTICNADVTVNAGNCTYAISGKDNIHINNSDVNLTVNSNDPDVYGITSNVLSVDKKSNVSLNMNTAARVATGIYSNTALAVSGNSSVNIVMNASGYDLSGIFTHSDVQVTKDSTVSVSMTADGDDVKAYGIYSKRSMKFNNSSVTADLNVSGTIKDKVVGICSSENSIEITDSTVKATANAKDGVSIFATNGSVDIKGDSQLDLTYRKHAIVSKNNITCEPPMKDDLAIRKVGGNTVLDYKTALDEHDITSIRNVRIPWFDNPVPPAPEGVPTTGDDAPIALWAVLALASLCALMAMRRRQLAK